MDEMLTISAKPYQVLIDTEDEQDIVWSRHETADECLREYRQQVRVMKETDWSDLVLGVRHNIDDTEIGEIEVDAAVDAQRAVDADV